LNKPKKKPNFNKRAKEYMDSLNYLTEIVEHYNAFSGRKNDFGGFLDAICLNPDAEKNKILGLQITGKSNISARFNKITKGIIKDAETHEDEYNPIPAKAKTWLRSGAGIWIIGFDSAAKTGKIRDVFLGDDGEFEFQDSNIAD
jgi:hypothetical protein